MRNEPCFCGSGKKAKKCHKDVKPDSSFAKVTLLYQKIDEKIQKEIGNIRCKKGCFSCCYQSFGISSVEFYNVMNYIIENQGIEKAKELIDKGYEIWTEFEEKYPKEAELLKMNAMGKEGIRESKFIDVANEEASNLLYGKKPCPMLNEETGACSVYEVRPVACRTFGVAYEEKLDFEFRICNHIEDGLTYQEEMADISEYKNDVLSLSAAIVNERPVVDRAYPFFYFLKIQKGKEDVMLRKIDEFKNYSLNKVYERKMQRMLGS